MEEALALCRSLLMEVFYEFTLRVYCMIIKFLFKADLILDFG